MSASGPRGAAPAHATGGFEGTESESLAIWEADAERYHSAGSPWRPSAGDAAVYRRLAGARLGGRVLVLGVTPELRDAVADAGGQAVVVDISAAMYAAATAMLRRANPNAETWLRADWCDPSVPTDEFDLAVGDNFFWAVSVRKQHELRERLHTALKPDGLLVTRTRLVDPTRADKSVVSWMQNFLQQVDRSPEDEQAIRGASYSWLYDHTTDREHYRLDREGAHALVLELATTSEFSLYEEYLGVFAARLPGPNWTSQTREELLDVLSGRFEVVDQGRADDYDSSFYPVLAFRRR
jgi:SAM-dependent methyltransferase